MQTNRDSAVQIELVGFAHLPKDRRALTNLARLCRWIESTHDVPRTWPAGPPRPARNGQDPGGHNRNPEIWDNEGGHYGHCHVPENTHWDPAYTQAEAAFVMEATFDTAGRLISPEPPPLPSRMRRGKGRARAPESTMPDHGVVPLGVGAYIRDLPLPPAEAAPTPVPSRRKARAMKAAPTRRRAEALAPVYDAKVNVGSLMSFVEGVSEQEKNDVLYSVQLAQRGASGSFDRFTQTQSWYQKYVEIDPRYFRPAEVDELRGDMSKAKKLLKWEPKVKFKELVTMMTDADLQDARKNGDRSR